MSIENYKFNKKNAKVEKYKYLTKTHKPSWNVFVGFDPCPTIFQSICTRIA